MGQILLITGGARSGKSAYALERAEEWREQRRFFVATAQALDAEMAERIARHRHDRASDFTTIEEPIGLAGVLQGLERRADLVVVDCLTLWVSNLMGVYPENIAAPFLAEAGALAEALAAAPFASIVVTDEVGDGIVPENPVARRFRDLLGWTNQAVARAATEVILMVAGYPVRVK